MFPWEGLARNFDLIPEQERELAGISDLVTSTNCARPLTIIESNGTALCSTPSS